MLNLIVFDISGFMGHFRKVYSTTSSLSYFFPPRTTITGLVAGMLGRDRDTYYDEFSPEQCRVAIGLRGGIRKLVQQVLYLNTDTLSERSLRGIQSGGARVPTAFELLLPEPPQSQLSYRIYLHHKTPEVMKALTERLANKRYTYPLSLGPTECLAIPTFIGQIPAKTLTSKNPQPIHTVIPKPKLVEVKPKADRRLLREDRVPVAFNKDRYIRLIEDFIFEGKGRPLDAIISGELFKCQLGDDIIHGVFMA